MSVYIVYKTVVIYTVIIWVFQAELRTGMWNYNSDYDVVHCAENVRKMSVIFLRWTFICPEPPRPKCPKKYAVAIFVQKTGFTALCSGTTFEIRVW